MEKCVNDPHGVFTSLKVSVLSQTFYFQLKYEGFPLKLTWMECCTILIPTFT